MNLVSSLLSVILALVCLGVYHNALQAGWTFDDHLAIEGNADAWCFLPAPSALDSPPKGPDAGREKKGDANTGTDDDLVSLFVDLQRGPFRFHDFMTHDFWGKPVSSESSHRSYRPLTIGSFRASSCLSLAYHQIDGGNGLLGFLATTKLPPSSTSSETGGSEGETAPKEARQWAADKGLLEPFPFHLVNILLHCAVTVSFFQLCVKLVSDQTAASPESSSGTDFAVSFLAALLFAVHPVHVEAVTSIVGRAELLCALFGFRLLHSVWEWETAFNEEKIFQRALELLVFFWLACLSKDSGVTFGGVAFAFVCIRRIATVTIQQRNDSLWATRIFTPFFFSDSPYKRFAVLPPVLLVSCCMCYLQFRAVFLPGVDLAESPLLRKAENPHLFLEPAVHKSLFLWYLQGKNLQLILWPWPLCAEYSFNCIPGFEQLFGESHKIIGGEGTPSSSWLDFLTSAEMLTTISSREPRLVLAALGLFFASYVVLKYVGLTVYLWLGSSDCEANPHVAARRASFIALGLLTYLPVSHLLVTVGTMIAERCLYLPSAAICFLLVDSSLTSLAVNTRQKSTLRFAVGFLFWIGVALLFAVMTLTRNLDWFNDETLFKSSVKVCPTSAKHHQQLALLRLNQMRVEEARELLQKAEVLDADYCEPSYHLARIALNATGDRAKALMYLRRCATCKWSSENCLPLYQQLLPLVKPAQSYAEQAFGNAELLVRLAEGASYFQDEYDAAYASAARQYRQTGLALLQSPRSTGSRSSSSASSAAPQFAACSAAWNFIQSHAIRSEFEFIRSLEREGKQEIRPHSRSGGVRGAVEKLFDGSGENGGKSTQAESKKKRKEQEEHFCNNAYWLLQSLVDCSASLASDSSLDDVNGFMPTTNAFRQRRMGRSSLSTLWGLDAASGISSSSVENTAALDGSLEAEELLRLNRERKRSGFVRAGQPQKDTAGASLLSPLQEISQLDLEQLSNCFLYGNASATGRAFDMGYSKRSSSGEVSVHRTTLAYCVLNATMAFSWKLFHPTLGIATKVTSDQQHTMGALNPCLRADDPVAVSSVRASFLTFAPLLLKARSEGANEVASSKQAGAAASPTRDEALVNLLVSRDRRLDDEGTVYSQLLLLEMALESHRMISQSAGMGAKRTQEELEAQISLEQVLIDSSRRLLLTIEPFPSEVIAKALRTKDFREKSHFEKMRSWLTKTTQIVQFFEERTSEPILMLSEGSGDSKKNKKDLSTVRLRAVLACELVYVKSAIAFFLDELRRKSIDTSLEVGAANQQKKVQFLAQHEAEIRQFSSKARATTLVDPKHSVEVELRAGNLLQAKHKSWQEVAASSHLCNVPQCYEQTRAKCDRLHQNVVRASNKKDKSEKKAQ